MSSRTEWKPGPFPIGQSYRVKKTFTNITPPNRVNEEGEIWRYRKQMYTPYDDLHFFEFVDGNDIRYWEVGGDEPISVWTEFFEAV